RTDGGGIRSLAAPEAVGAAELIEFHLPQSRDPATVGTTSQGLAGGKPWFLVPGPRRTMKRWHLDEEFGPCSSWRRSPRWVTWLFRSCPTSSSNIKRPRSSARIGAT